MPNLLNIEPWWRFGAAILIGALVGLEREFVQQRAGEPDFAGIRTFSLMALLGAVVAFLTAQHGILPFVVVYVGLALLVWVSYLGDVLHGRQEGITTEVAALLVPLLGAMVVWDLAELAIALGVITALVLSQKPRLHTIARRMSTQDLWATLEFALIAAVVLPLLPNRTFGPLDVLNPYETWLLVVFVSGVGFLGYVLMKVLGAERGIGLTGLLGGLASSTATTLSFAGRSKKTPALSGAFGSAIVLASTMMFPRVLIEVLVVYRPLIGTLIIPVGAMLLTGCAVFAILWRRERSTEVSDQGTVDLTNPLDLSTAIKFALLFVVVLVATKAANRFFGSLGVYVASVIAGLTDVDSITLSVSELAGKGQIETRVATVAIVLAVLTNTITKGAMALALGSRELRRPVIPAFGAMVLVGIISAAALLLLGSFGATLPP
jgi:uncharacterized membrane protein (DUF4010 family)